MDFVKLTKISSIIARLFNLFFQQLVLILKSLTSNEYTVKESFALAEESVEQDSEFFMGNVNVGSLFTPALIHYLKILKELIEFKELLSLATK